MKLVHKPRLAHAGFSANGNGVKAAIGVSERSSQLGQLLCSAVKSRQPAAERDIEAVPKRLWFDCSVKRHGLSDALERALAERLELEEAVDQAMGVRRQHHGACRGLALQPRRNVRGLTECQGLRAAAGGGGCGHHRAGRDADPC
jgi:hypothetical protein